MGIVRVPCVRSEGAAPHIEWKELSVDAKPISTSVIVINVVMTNARRPVESVIVNLYCPRAS